MQEGTFNAALKLFNVIRTPEQQYSLVSQIYMMHFDENTSKKVLLVEQGLNTGGVEYLDVDLLVRHAI